MKVLSLLPRSRFTESGMALPESLSLHFLPPNGSHVLIAAAESAQALLLPPSQPYVDAFCLERMPSIRFIQTTGAGFDSVDHLTAAELGIPVSNSPNMNASSVAEYVIAAIVNLQRGLAWADGEIRRGRYAASRAELLEQGGLELRGCRIGLLGLGNIGRAENPFLSIPAERVLLTPHLAGVTRAAFGRMLSQALENLERVLVHGLPPRFVVNGVLADYSD